MNVGGGLGPLARSDPTYDVLDRQRPSGELVGECFEPGMIQVTTWGQDFVLASGHHVSSR